MIEPKDLDPVERLRWDDWEGKQKLSADERLAAFEEMWGLMTDDDKRNLAITTGWVKHERSET